MLRPPRLVDPKHCHQSKAVRHPLDILFLLPHDTTDKCTLSIVIYFFGFKLELSAHGIAKINNSIR